MIPTDFLGQAGFRFDFNGLILFIDPYLSDRVERIEGAELKRQRPVPFHPGSVSDADYLLITHGHMDHCDPETILPMLASSTKAKVIGPHAVIDFLIAEGMASEQGVAVSEETLIVNEELSITALPAAHPTIEHDASGYLACLGFVITYKGKRIYHSGDTSPDDTIINALRRIGPIDVALLPINEKNFYRDKAGIIGNMSIREAFGMATDISAAKVVPMHYDMFKANQTYLDELKVVYRELAPPFEMIIEPSELVL
jgi:L-ascorbate 6-phosphate lactonase